MEFPKKSEARMTSIAIEEMFGSLTEAAQRLWALHPDMSRRLLIEEVAKEEARPAAYVRAALIANNVSSPQASKTTID